MMWWEILELTAEADQKAIKVAYAKKLKKTRPDDDPEGFKTLHAAYQQALAWQAHKEQYADFAEDEAWEEKSTTTNAETAASERAQSQTKLPLSFTAHQTDENPTLLSTAYLAAPQLVVLETDSAQLQTTLLQAPLVEQSEADTLKTSTIAPVIAVQDPPIAETNTLDTWSDPEEQFVEDWCHFQQQLSTNIHTETARKNPQDWMFLEQLPSFMDLEFRERLSLELFGFISESNLKAAEQKTLFIKAPVLDYLNQLFAWETQWRYFTEQFGEQQADAILLHIKATQTSPKNTTHVQPEELYYYSRFLAFVLDVLLMLGLSLLLTDGLGVSYNLALGFNPYPLLLSVLALPIMEASTWQASLGKRIVGLKVVNQQGQPLTITRSYWRFFATVICILGFKVVVWINLFLAYKRSMLLQDWVTQSYVIKKT